MLFCKRSTVLSSPWLSLLFVLFLCKGKLETQLFAVNVVQETQWSALRQDLLFPCHLSVPVTHAAKMCISCFSLATRKTYLVLAKKYAEAVCLKRGLGYQNLTECGYRWRRLVWGSMFHHFFVHLVFSSLVLSFSVFASAVLFCFHF